MQAIVSSSLFIYIIFYVFESVIRYGFHLVGKDELIFVRDGIIALLLAVIFVQQFLKRKVHVAYPVYLFVVLLHGAIMIMNTGSWIAVAYSAKMLISMLAGALFAGRLFKPTRFAVLVFLILWGATAVGVVLDKYLVEFPWAGMQTTIGDIQVDISHDWEISGEDKRAGGFTRSSINVAFIEPLMALLLMFNLRSILLRVAVALGTLPILYFTTQKGAMAAYLLTLGFLCMIPKRPILGLRIGFFLMLAIAIALPLILVQYYMPNTAGVFSMSSFYLRVEDMWPRAWTWVSENDMFPFGVGLGGISGAQRLYAPYQIDYADNIFVFMYAYFGMMTFVYLGWLCVTVWRARGDSGKSAMQAMATLVFLIGYGCVLSIIEDQMGGLFLGAAMTWLAHENQRQHRAIADENTARPPVAYPGAALAAPA